MFGIFWHLKYGTFTNPSHVRPTNDFGGIGAKWQSSASHIVRYKHSWEKKSNTVDFNVLQTRKVCKPITM